MRNQTGVSFANSNCKDLQQYPVRTDSAYTIIVRAEIDIVLGAILERWGCKSGGLLIFVVGLFKERR
jgi:hypothetical protein